jgi:spermidine synthase
MTISLFAIGLISILGQVVLLRELNVAFYGVELIYILSLGLWLFWTAAGALAGRKNLSPTPESVAWLFGAFALMLPLDVAFIRASRVLLSDIPGAYLSFFRQMLVALAALFPAGFLSGLLFQRAAKLFIAKNKTLAFAYAVESVGGLIGGLCSTWLILRHVSNFSTALLCSLLAAMTVLITPPGRGKSFFRGVSVVLTAVLGLLLTEADYLDNVMTRWNHPYLLKSIDSPYGRTTATKRYHQLSIFENDALAWETEGTEAEVFCHLAALQHPHPQTVLVLGGGMEGLIREIQKYKPHRVDYVELNAPMFETLAAHLPEDIRNSLGQLNVRIIFADPRRFLGNSGRYDMILVGMPEPSSAQANRFYTREFFKQCASRLNPGGILALRLLTPENVWTEPFAARNASIFGAARSIFASVLFLPATTGVLTASDVPLPDAPDVMAQRLEKMKLDTRLVSPAYLRYLFTNDRFFRIRNLLNTQPATPNTDIRPVCYQYAFVIWLSKFFPRLSLMDLPVIARKDLVKPPFLLLWSFFVLVFGLSRFRPAVRRWLLVGMAGFLGMVLETILLLLYQTKNGVLYQDIGWLLTCFMAGLAAGAFAVGRFMSRPDDNPLQSLCQGFSLMVGFVFLCAAILWTITSGSSAGLPQISMLLIVNGFLVGGVFAYAGLQNTVDPKKIVSPLYASDLLGGCLGSLLASLALIPLIGMDVTFWMMLILSFFSLLLT